MLLYSIKDRMADEFAPVFLSVNDATALRSARQSMSKYSPDVSKDFELYQVGAFDLSTGLLESLVSPKLVIGDFSTPSPVDSLNKHKR